MRMLAITVAVALAFVTAAPPSSAMASGLVSTIAKDMGKSRPKGCPGRWCACYLNLALKKAGYAPFNSNRARDFARYGKPARAGQVGAIMVMSGHVGVVAGKCGDGRIRVLSGNHGNRVGEGCYSAARAIAWRAPVRGKSVAKRVGASWLFGSADGGNSRAAPVSLVSQ